MWTMTNHEHMTNQDFYTCLTVSEKARWEVRHDSLGYSIVITCIPGGILMQIICFVP